MNQSLLMAKKLKKFNIIDFINSGKINQVLKDRFDSLYNGKDINGENELLFDIFENEIIIILEKPEEARTDQERRILDYTKKSYLQIIKKCYPHFCELLVTCKLFQKPYSEKLFKDDYVKISEFYNKVSNEVVLLYKKYMDNEELTNREQVLLFKYLISCLSSNNPAFQNIFQNVVKRILGNKLNVNIFGKEFLIKYIVKEKCQRLGIPFAPTYIGNNYLYGNQKLENPGMHQGYTIIIQQELMKLDLSKPSESWGVSRFALLVAVISHELEHYNQEYEMANGKISISAWNYTVSSLLRKDLSTKEWNEYMANYDYVETEHEANLAGWREAATFLNTYSPMFIDDIKGANKLYSRIRLTDKYAHKKEIDSLKNIKSFDREKYNIKHLHRIIKANPNLLKENPVLSIIFDENGLKNLGKLVKEYTEYIKSDNPNLKDIEKIFYEAFDYYFSTMDLNEIDKHIDKFPLEEQYVIFGLIANRFDNECVSLKDMMDCYNDKYEELFYKIGSQRILRMQKYYKYMNSHKEKINDLAVHMSELRRKGKGVSIVYGSNIENMNRGMLSFPDRVDIWNPEFKETRFANGLRKIPQMLDDEDFVRLMGQTKEEFYESRTK